MNRERVQDLKLHRTSPQRVLDLGCGGGFFLFILLPVVVALGLSFFRWDVFHDAKFIGLRNFEFLLRDNTFWAAFRNNVFFALSVPFQLAIPLVLAFLIQQRIPGWRFYRVMVVP